MCCHGFFAKLDTLRDASTHALGAEVLYCTMAWPHCALQASTCLANIYISNDMFSYFQELFIDSYKDALGNSEPES